MRQMSDILTQLVTRTETADEVENPPVPSTTTIKESEPSVSFLFQNESITGVVLGSGNIRFT